MIPKDIRDHFGLKEGSVVTFEVKGDAIVLKPLLPPEKFIESFCSSPLHKRKKG